MSEIIALHLTGSADGVSAIPQTQRATESYRFSDPLFILAPPRSFTSVVGAMIGQHPQMYGLPETHLFKYETMSEHSESCREATYPMGHGLLRAVAQLCYGEQTETTIKQADGWLRRRSHFSTGHLLEVLAELIYPLILVEKSPSVVYSLQALHRIHDLFPQARFLHLLRHPRGHGESVMKYIAERRRHGPIPRSHWLLHLAIFPDLSPGAAADDKPERNTVLDPQRGWYVLHRNICMFLESIPETHTLRIRGEDLLTDPDFGLRQIADWIGLRTDAQAIEEMKHPERSPYACFGPPGARYGNDVFFLESPALRPSRARLQNLGGPLSWRSDGADFLPEVKQLARGFGYE